MKGGDLGKMRTGNEGSGGLKRLKESGHQEVDSWNRRHLYPMKLRHQWKCLNLNQRILQLQRREKVMVKRGPQQGKSSAHE